MKKYLSLAVGCLLAASGHNAKAAIYGDATGDIFTGAGGGILDITSVEVNNTATDLIFKINLAGDPVATDWGKYMIAIDSVPGGDTVGNGWARPISMPSGMDAWVGNWVDSGNGGEVYNWQGAFWPNPAGSPGSSATYAGNVAGQVISKNSSFVTVSFNFGYIGLSLGDSFVFDVFTSGGGGGDSAVDALANPTPTIGNWGDPYSTQSTLSYTIPQVPEPATAAVLGLGALVVFSRMRRK
jgi:hypothetical protein